MRHNYPLREESLMLLACLVKFGTCSNRTLAWMTGRDPDHVLRSLDLLAAKGLVTKLSTAVAGRPAVHVQISGGPEARATVARVLGISESALPKRGFPITQLEHEDRCARLHFRVTRAHPSYLVVRDWAMHRGEIPEAVLPKSFHRDGSIPDLMIGIPGPASLIQKDQRASRKWIAIELDRTRKKLARLREKLHLYARETQIDGLFYVLPEWSLVNSLGRYFEESVAPRALRIRNFKDVFLARTLLGEEDREPFEMKLICEDRVTSLSEWCRLIETTSSHERSAAWRELGGFCPRNSFFEHKKPND